MDTPAESKDRDHVAEFAAWLQNARAVPAQREVQSPCEELLGEHYLIESVLAAMEAEALRLNQGEDLRAGFWGDVVDFIGNFVHLSHRVKEETAFYPAVVRGGLIEASRSDDLEQEHDNARRLTLGICEGVESGDWEQVIRLVSMYVYFQRHHMKNEELELVLPFMRQLDASMDDEIASAFRAVEATALAVRDRRHYVDLARRLCDAAGVAHGLLPASD
jgi:hemerythrin-like domain-containing protein